jgi:hypothetical protein
MCDILTRTRQFQQVGDHTHNLIRKCFGETTTLTCGCGAMIAEMNATGPDGVRANIDKYVGYLAEQADKQKWFDVKPKGGKRLRWWKFLAALPGRDTAIKQLILHACRLAEKDAAKNLLPKSEISTIIQNNKQPIDVVYTIGNGSKWNNNELRYSLRSLETYGVGLGRVFVVGYKPDWLINVVHIPMSDTYRYNKDANIIDKVRAAISAGISEKFIFCSDDQALLSMVNLHDLPVYRNEDMSSKENWGTNRWHRRMRKTRDYLVSKNLPAINYDTHVFQPHLASEFENIVSNIPYTEHNGFCINTLVLNHMENVQSKILGKDKASFYSRSNNVESIKNIIPNKIHLGYNNAGLTDSLKSVLSEIFPVPSRFEISTSESTVRGIVMLAGGDTYALNAFLNCYLLRHMGCTLPIEWFYLGPELSESWQNIILNNISNISLIDLGGTSIDNTREKGGWQAKVEAVLHSRFDEILFLDADAFPVQDPTYLFEHEEFKKHDLVMWLDTAKWKRSKAKKLKNIYHIDINSIHGRNQIESGQMLIRKEKCLEGLYHTQKINQNWKVSYKFMLGDKESFLLGAILGKTNYFINPHRPIRDKYRNATQYDLDGQKLLIHLARFKWTPNKPASVNVSDFPNHDIALNIYNQLQEIIFNPKLSSVISSKPIVSSTRLSGQRSTGGCGGCGKKMLESSNISKAVVNHSPEILSEIHKPPIIPTPPPLSGPGSKNNSRKRS